jgi:P-type conjugative transfer protein TrbL
MKKFFLIVLGVLILSNFALAEVSTNNNAQGILKIFADNADIWNAYIIPYAYSLFYYLVVIDWVYTFSMMALKGTDFNEIMAGLIQKVFIIGFFMIMFNYTYWLDLIPKSFAQMANSMTSVTIQPDTILEQGYKIVGKLWKGTSWLSSPGDSLSLVFAGIIILFGFIVMTAQLFMVKVKLYFLILGSYFMLALGGLGYTRSMGVSAIIAVFKAGFELFFITLILGFSIVVINQMAANVGTDNNSIMAMIGTSILIAYLTTMVNGLVESLTNGTLGGNGNLAGSVKNTMQGAGQGAVGGASGAMSSVAAVKAASAVGSSPTLPGVGNSGSSESTGRGTGKIGSFIKSAATGIVGAAAGATSGAIKGSVGISTHSAGQKSGSKVGNLVGSIGNKAVGSSTGGSSTNNNEDLLNGVIASANQNNNNDNSENSSYISGVPGSNNEL